MRGRAACRPVGAPSPHEHAWRPVVTAYTRRHYSDVCGHWAGLLRGPPANLSAICLRAYIKTLWRDAAADALVRHASTTVRCSFRATHGADRHSYAIYLSIPSTCLMLSHNASWHSLRLHVRRAFKSTRDSIHMPEAITNSCTARKFTETFWQCCSQARRATSGVNSPGYTNSETSIGHSTSNSRRRECIFNIFFRFICKIMLHGFKDK